MKNNIDKRTRNIGAYDSEGNLLSIAEQKNKKNLTPRQDKNRIIVSKNKIPELTNIPYTSFVTGITGSGIFNIGLLAPRLEIPRDYTPTTIAGTNKEIIDTPNTYLYFFIMYDNQNLSGGLESILKSYSVIKTLSYITIKDCSEMLKMHYTNIVPLTKEQYDLDSYEHYTYTNASNTPLIIRYAEISIIKQITPGRLDDIPLGYPDFDSTADGVLTRKGPLPAPPYTDFSTATGATFNVSIIPGESISFKDTTVKTPWQFAPTGWGWVFGPTASPTGSNLQNPIVTYGATGIYTVTLTAYNAAGQTTKTKNNFVIVTSI